MTLTAIDRSRVQCFFDQRTIQSGADWKADLQMALRRTDWLICVYTGKQSEFCGLEVGYFAELGYNEEVNGVRDRRVVCLHDVAKLPGIYSGYQNHFIDFPAELQVGGQTLEDQHFYRQASITQFLSNFCMCRELYPVRDIANATRQENSLVSKAERITESFATARGGATIDAGYTTAGASHQPNNRSVSCT